MRHSTLSISLAVACAAACTFVTVAPASAAAVICNQEKVRNTRGQLVGRIDANPTHFLYGLRERGVDAVGVEDFNGCIRAYVRQPGGGQAMQYYDPDTYQRLR